MSEARATDRPVSTDADVARASRERETGEPRLALRGRLQSPPLGRLGRGLVYGTGLFLLRPLALLIRRLLVWERRAEVAWEDGVLHLQTELTVLGTSLQSEDERVPAAHISSAATTTRHAPEFVAYGALVAGVAVIWGLWQLVDGIHGRSGGLVAMGLLAMVVGIAVDVALLWARRFIPGSVRHGVIVRTRDGRPIALDGLAEHNARRLRDKILENIK